MPAETDAERLARRYPQRRTSTPVLFLLGVLIAVLVGYVVWVATYRANPPVTARIDSFSVVSDAQLDASVTVDRPDPSRPARCLFAVQAETFERVGEKFVDIGPGDQRLTVISVSVRTFKRGTTIIVDGCGLVG